MTKPRYKNRSMEQTYQTCLRLARDKTSEFYHKGQPRRGASHRCAFWDGYSGRFSLYGKNRTASAIPGTLSHACFMAGVDYRKEEQS